MNVSVKNKDNNETYEVYDISYDKAGYPHFLVYKNNQWVRMSAKHFRPLGAEDFEKILKDCPIMEISI